MALNGIEMLLGSFGIDPAEIKKNMEQFGGAFVRMAQEIDALKKEQARNTVMLEGLCKAAGVEIPAPVETSNQNGVVENEHTGYAGHSAEPQ